jgi:hypothetical protein
LPDGQDRHGTNRDFVSDAAVLNPNLMAAFDARYHLSLPTRNKETEMKFALIGAAAIAAAAFATPALAQDVASAARYCAQYYPDGYCPVAGYVDGRDYRGDDWGNAMAPQWWDNNQYRYHGGPKYND